MPKYNVEYAAHVYVTVPVDAADEDAAEQAADKILPRFPVVATLADGCPDGLTVDGPGKYFEVNQVHRAENEPASVAPDTV